MCWFGNVLVCECAGVGMCWHWNVLVWECAGVRMCWYGNVLRRGWSYIQDIRVRSNVKGEKRLKSK